MVPLGAHFTLDLGKMLNEDRASGTRLRPYLRNSNVQWGAVDLRDLKEMHFDPWERARYGLRQGDLLICEGGQPGRAAIWGGELAEVYFQKALHRARPRHPGALTKWLFYLLRACVDEQVFTSDSGTTTIAHLTGEQLSSLRLPFPRVDEQRRIAEFLDDQVARCDEAAATLEGMLQILSDRELTILRSGVAGALTQRVISSPLAWLHEVGVATEIKPLSAVLRLQRGVDLTADERAPGPYPVITTAGVSGTHDRPIVRREGVVVGRYGSVGNVHWVDGPHWPHNTTLYVSDYRGNQPKFVYYLLRAYPWDALQARAAVPGVNRNDMKADLVPVMQPDNQDSAVAALELELQRVAGLRAAASSELSLLEERKRALITGCVTGQFDVATASSRAGDAALQGVW